MKRTRFWVLISLVIVFVLSACEGWLVALKAENDLTINRNGSWKIVLQPTYAVADVETYSTDIETAMQTEVDGMLLYGISGSWKKVSTDSLGNVTYRVEFSGKNIQQLNDNILEDSTAVTSEGEGAGRLQHFNYYPNSNVFNDAIDWTFTLHAGRILSTNGTQQNPRTVVWTDPYQYLTADFQSGSSWPTWLTIVLIVVGILALAGAVVAIILTSKKKARPGLPPPYMPTGSLPPPPPGMPLPAADYKCTKCGNTLAAGVAFCPKCGTKRAAPAAPPPVSPPAGGPPPVTPAAGTPPPMVLPPMPPAMPKKKK